MRRTDYQKKEYHNPTLPRRQTPQKKRRWIFVLVLICGLGVGMWLVEHATAITHVDVDGTSLVSNQEIIATINEQSRQRRWFILSQKSTLFFDRHAAEKTLTERFGLASAVVTKEPFTGLKISIAEIKPAAVLISHDNQYYIDQEGIVFRQFQPATVILQSVTQGTKVLSDIQTAGSFPTIVDQSNSEPTIHERAIKKELLVFILQLDEALKQKKDITITHYAVANLYADQVIVETTEHWQAYFRATDDPLKQIQALVTVFQQPGFKRDRLQYIDVRFGEKVFYK